MSTVEAPIIHGTISVQTLYVGNAATSGLVDTTTHAALQTQVNAIDTILNNADTTVSADSANLVTSGAVKTAIDNLNASSSSSSSSPSSWTPGTDFVKWHEFHSRGALLNLWNETGTHSGNNTLSDLGSTTRGSDIEVFFRIWTLQNSSDSYSGKKHDIYFKGFYLDRTFDVTYNIPDMGSDGNFTSGNEQFKLTSLDSYTNTNLDATRQDSAWEFCFGHNFFNGTNYTKSVMFGSDNVYGIAGGGSNRHNGLEYQAEMWVKPLSSTSISWTPGTDFVKWHEFHSSGALLNLWNQPGTHSGDDTLSTLGPDPTTNRGSDIEVFFRIWTEQDSSITDSGKKTDIYFKGFYLDSTFDTSASAFTSGNEQFKFDSSDSYTDTNLGATRVDPSWPYTFGDINYGNWGNAAAGADKSLIFDTQKVYGAAAGGGNYFTGLKYQAEIWIKAP